MKLRMIIAIMILLFTECINHLFFISPDTDACNNLSKDPQVGIFAMPGPSGLPVATSYVRVL